MGRGRSGRERQTGRQNRDYEVPQSNSSYGTLIRTYGDGTRAYETSETTSGNNLNEEQRQWVRAMDSVVRSDIRSALEADGVRRADFDVDFDNNRVTAWVNVSRQASASGLARAYYDIDYTFDVRTSVRPDGTVRRDYSYRSLRLVLRGVNAY